MFSFREEIPSHSFHGEIGTEVIGKNHRAKLKTDFNHRCAYCNDADYLFAGGAFHIDHFAPKSKFPERKRTYENLMYSCPYCNQSKGNTWISESADEPVVGNRGFENPTSSSYDTHFMRGTHGEIIPIDSLGEYMWENLGLMLLRHSCLCRMDAMHQRIKMLQGVAATIEIESIREAATTLCNELKQRFYDYYFPLLEENE